MEALCKTHSIGNPEYQLPLGDLGECPTQWIFPVYAEFERGDVREQVGAASAAVFVQQVRGTGSVSVWRVLGKL